MITDLSSANISGDDTDLITVIECLRLFDDSDSLWMKPPTLQVLDQSFAGVLLPELGSRPYEIARLINQSRITVQRKIEALPLSMISVEDAKVSLQIMKAWLPRFHS